MAELDWALANMDGQRGRKGAKPSNELVEADAKAVNSKEEVFFSFYSSPLIVFSIETNSYLLQLNLKGLGALLFDDGEL